MSITVTARGVVKAFDGKPVLRGADLDVPEGRSTVLVGPSSGGKSVLGFGNEKTQIFQLIAVASF